METFMESWKSMEDLFDEDEPVFEYDRKILAFIKEGRKRGYDQCFRIGISMSTLIISKQEECLRSGDSYLAFRLLGGKLIVECCNLPVAGFVQDEIYLSERVMELLDFFKNN